MDAYCDNCEADLAERSKKAKLLVEEAFVLPRVRDILDPAGELTAEELVKRAERWRDLISRADSLGYDLRNNHMEADCDCGDVVEFEVPKEFRLFFVNDIGREAQSILRSQRKVSEKKK